MRIRTGGSSPPIAGRSILITRCWRETRKSGAGDMLAGESTANRCQIFKDLLPIANGRNATNGSRETSEELNFILVPRWTRWAGVAEQRRLLIRESIGATFWLILKRNLQPKCLALTSSTRSLADMCWGHLMRTYFWGSKLFPLAAFKFSLWHATMAADNGLSLMKMPCW